MKKNFRKSLVLVVFIVTIMILAITIYVCNNQNNETIQVSKTEIKAAETIKTKASSTSTVKYNVTDAVFGANGTDKKDDRAAIQKALDKAKDEIMNKKNRTVEITIPKGTYYIGKMLYIYSNTKLVVDKDAVIVGGLEKDKYLDDLIKGSHIDNRGNYCGNEECFHGEHEQWKNITIEGGTWDCNNPDDPNTEMVGAFLFRHGTGLTIKNLTIKNSTGHTINPSASKNILISGVTIKDARASTKADFSVEAIHLDSANTGEQTAYPVDGTEIENATIQNCTFDNVYSGIGCHSIYRTAKGNTLSSNIKILNNTFKNIKCYCINAIAFRNMTIQGNTATGKNEKNVAGGKKGYAFIYTRNCTGSKVLISNTTSGGANKISNFEYPIVKYDFKVNSFSDEASNNLTSNKSLQSSFVCIDYTANGGTGSDIRKKVSIITNKSQSKSFTLASNTFTRAGYKFKNWKVTLNTGTGEKAVGTYNPGATISTTDLRWHHSTYKVYAQWTKMSSITLSTKPSKLNYTAGEELSLSGGKITAKYADGTSTSVSLPNSKVKVTGYDNTKIGNQTVTLEYEGLKTTYTVNVKKPTKVGPTLTITSNPSATKTNASSITYTFTWSEKVTDFDINDVDVTNGTKGKFTAVSGGKKYTLVVTNSKDCEQVVSVKEYRCKDVSGNLNTTGKSLTRTIDRTVPTVTIISNPNTSTISASSVTYTFTWSENVKGFTKDDITVVNGTKGTFSGSGKQYNLVVTNTGNCVQKVNVTASKCTDEAGNNNKASTVISRTIQRTSQVTKPKVTVSTAQSGSNIIFTFQWNESVTGFDASDIEVTNGTKGQFNSVYQNRVYQLFVKKTSSTMPTVSIKANTCTDSSGNGNEPYNINGGTSNAESSTNTNVKKPKVTISAYEDKATGSIRYVFQFDTTVTGFDVNDITVTNGVKSNFSTLYSGRVYQLFVKKSSSGTQTVKVNANVCTDLNGNGNEASNVITKTIK